MIILGKMVCCNCGYAMKGVEAWYSDVNVLGVRRDCFKAKCSECGMENLYLLVQAGWVKGEDGD